VYRPTKLTSTAKGLPFERKNLVLHKSEHNPRHHTVASREPSRHGIVSLAKTTANS